MKTISEYLSTDHKRCDQLFATAEHSVDQGNWKQAKAAFQHFSESQLHHLTMEETILFPAFENATGNTHGPTSVMCAEHKQMLGIMQQMDDAIAEQHASNFFGCAETLNILLQQHNMKEESMLYPMTDRALSSKCHEIIDAMDHIDRVIASLDKVD
ncbi:MAG: hemerythrin domain-containing protein [Glaciimonas sp.]|nr:hemerythrin domain-containing protein [Glaciimonas sp.]